MHGHKPPGSARTVIARAAVSWTRSRSSSPGRKVGRYCAAQQSLECLGLVVQGIGVEHPGGRALDGQLPPLLARRMCPSGDADTGSVIEC